MTCEETRRLAAELALDVVDGAERAQALRHLAECADCRRAVKDLSEVADELLMVAPEREPPAGFESRVVGRLGLRSAPARRGRRVRGVLIALGSAAVAAVVTLALVMNATSDDRRIAARYKATLAEAHGRYFEAARLQQPGGLRAGVVFGYQGMPSWIFVTVDRPFRARGYMGELVTTSGRRLELPSLRLDPATGSAGQAIPVDLHSIATVRLVGEHRGDVLEAQLPHGRRND
jgi:hypothetical protein